MKTAYFTICSRNYLAYALTLRESFLRAHSSAEFFIYLADDNDEIGAAPEDAQIIAASEIEMPALWDMALRYSIMEFNTAIKPFCILDLWDKRGFDAAVYIDPDIYVLAPLADVEVSLAAGADCVLTPHLCAPLEDGFHPDDIQIMRTGIYNLGFGAFANSAGGRRFVEWWSRRCERECIVDLENGLFVDQKFADYAPAFCDNAHILRDPGYNIAYWNIKNRPVSKRGDVWFAAESPIKFFHFSGVVPGNAQIFSKHQNRFSVEDIGDARYLLAEYLAALDHHGHAAWRATPYAFDRFSDGKIITPEMRRVYADANIPPPTNRNDAFNPFYGVLNTLSPNAPRGRDASITRLMYEIWKSRNDLQDVFPLSTADGRRGFLGWFISSGPKEHGVPEICLDPARRALAQPINEHGDTAKNKDKPGPLAKGGAHSRKILRTAYNMAPPIRSVYARLPAEWRMSLRRYFLKEDSKFDAQRAMAAPTISPACGVFNDELTVGVDVYGYFRTESGVGEGARRAFAALECAGIPARSVTLGTQGVFRDSVEWRGAEFDRPHRIALLHVNADQTPLIGLLTDPQRLDGTYRIGYWAWELSVFPDAWCGAFDLVDEIWAPSQFVASAISARTDKPVHVIPHPTPSDDPSECDRERFNLPQNDVLFFANLDLNSFTVRKNPLAVLEAFNLAFGESSDGVAMVFKIHGGRHLEKDRRALLDRFQEHPNVRVIDSVLSADELRNLQACCDVYVSLHRSEGFGLGILEFMSLGKPVIVTGYSGNMDFTHQSCARIVDYSLVEVGDQEYPYAEGQNWAEPDVVQAAEYMRELATNAALRKSLGARARSFVSERNSQGAIGAMMRARLESIDDALSL